MDNSDINGYRDLYLNNAKEILERIVLLLSEKPHDIQTLHRLFHTVKGQSYFMGHSEIGDVALKGEIILKSVIDEKKDLDDGDVQKLNKLIIFIKNKTDQL